MAGRKVKKVNMGESLIDIQFDYLLPYTVKN